MSTVADGEVPKRLAPTSETLRQLFLLSGNECAFDGCLQPLIDLDGVFVAEICHIEAAMPGGERFNAAMSNEDRRSAANLLLLCHRHHKVTDDVESYTVSRLRQLKAQHEARFSDGIDRMIASVSDRTLANVATPPESLARAYAFFGWSFDRDEHLVNLQSVIGLADRLCALSKPAREILEIVVRRGHRLHDGNVGIQFRELCDVTGLDERLLLARVEQLAVRRFAEAEVRDYEYYDVTGPIVHTTVARDDWPTVVDLKSYCEGGHASLVDIIVQLDFSRLD